MIHYKNIQPTYVDDTQRIAQALQYQRQRQDRLLEKEERQAKELAETNLAISKAIDGLGFNENEQEFKAELFNGLDEAVNTGDITTVINYASDIIKSDRVQNRIQSQANYKEFEDKVKKSNLSEDKKRYYLETNPYSYNETFNEETGKYEGTVWSPTNVNISEEVSIDGLRKYAQDEASKKLGNYGQLFYQTSDGSYTTNPALAKNIRPYYKNPNGSFTEVPVGKVNQELRDIILNNQTISNSLIQDYNYYKWKLDKGELNDIPYSQNPITDSKGNILTQEQYIDKVVNGYLDYAKPYIYYSNEYINPASTTGKNDTLLFDENGNYLSNAPSGKYDKNYDPFRADRIITTQGVNIKEEKGKSLTDSWVQEPEAKRNNILSVIRSSGIELTDSNGNDIAANLNGEELIDAVYKYYNDNKVVPPKELYKKLESYRKSIQEKESLSDKELEYYYNRQAQIALENGTNVDDDNPNKELLDAYRKNTIDFESATINYIIRGINLGVNKGLVFGANQGIKHMIENAIKGLPVKEQSTDVQYIPQEVVDLETFARMSAGYYNSVYERTGEDRDNTDQIKTVENILKSIGSNPQSKKIAIGVGNNPIAYGETVDGKGNSFNIDGTITANLLDIIGSIYRTKDYTKYITTTFDVVNGGTNITIDLNNLNADADTKGLIDSIKKVVKLGEESKLNVRVDNVFEGNKILNDFFNSPDINRARKLARIEYSTMDKYPVSTERGISSLTAKNGNYEFNGFNIQKEQALELLNAEDKLIDFDYKYQYNINKDYKLTEAETIELFSTISDLHPDVTNNITMDGSIRLNKHIANCTEYLSKYDRIHGSNLADQFDSIIDKYYNTWIANLK